MVISFESFVVKRHFEMHPHPRAREALPAERCPLADFSLGTECLSNLSHGPTQWPRQADRFAFNYEPRTTPATPLVARKQDLSKTLDQ